MGTLLSKGIKKQGGDQEKGKTEENTVEEKKVLQTEKEEQLSFEQSVLPLIP